MFELQTDISALHEKIEILKIHFIDCTHQLDKEIGSLRDLIDHAQTIIEKCFDRIESIEAGILDDFRIQLQNFNERLIFIEKDCAEFISQTVEISADIEEGMCL